MSVLRLPTAAAVAVLLAAPQMAAAQTTTTAKTQGAAAQATGKPTTDAPANTMVQGTAKAVQQGVVAGAPAAPMAKIAPRGDIIETARASGQFATFLKAADATNLTAVLKKNQNLTVFAPTDAAFAALPPGQLDRLMADKPALQKLLTHHIINARVESSKIKGAKGPVTSVAGDPIELDGSGATLRADNADIVQSDIMASNGILQVVDQVMMPGGAALAASASASATGTPASATTTTTTTTTTTPPAQATPKEK
jgi:uncharacterized surface protein with fasciclin (FAS1) repeats